MPRLERKKLSEPGWWKRLRSIFLFLLRFQHRKNHKCRICHTWDSLRWAEADLCEECAVFQAAFRELEHALKETIESHNRAWAASGFPSALQESVEPKGQPEKEGRA